MWPRCRIKRKQKGAQSQICERSVDFRYGIIGVGLFLLRSWSAVPLVASGDPVVTRIMRHPALMPRLSMHRRWGLTVIVKAAHARGGELIQLGLEPIERPIDTLGDFGDHLPGLLVVPLD